MIMKMSMKSNTKPNTSFELGQFQQNVPNLLTHRGVVAKVYNANFALCIQRAKFPLDKLSSFLRRIADLNCPSAV